MKALSILQPFATLIRIGAKQYESRSWSTSYRGPLLIHASKSMPKWARDLCKQQPFLDTLTRSGSSSDVTAHCGRIIAVVQLTDCIRITDANAPQGAEYAFGDYTPGRWMWKLENPEQCLSIPVKGNLGLWNIDSIPLLIDKEQELSNGD